MDKFMNNHWIMRIIALLLALMLYTSVNIETQTQQTDPFSFPVTTTETETLTEIPLEAYYDSDKYVVTGLPQQVSVTLEGPRSAVQPIKLQRSLEVFVNLENLELGTHQVQVQYGDVSDTVKVSINPTFVTVTIHEKVEREFSVEVDYIHELEEGFTLSEPIVSPKNVKVIGAKDQVDRIALVKAIVDLEGANEKIKKEAAVAVYDSEGNRLSVVVEPEVVNVEVNVLSPSKVVPITFIPKGTIEDGYSIIGLEPPANELTIFGPKNIIDQVKGIDNIEVDVEGISGNTTVNVPIPLPEGVIDVDPKTIPVLVKVERNEIRTLSNIPIKVIGLATSLKADFISPEEGRLSIELIGAPSILNEIDETDLDIYIDVSNLGSGQHDVNILVNGPENIKWNLSTNKATVDITNNQ
ncbi:YbbR-like domain-containing protein [Bacillus pinisoli]|uniref:CdaR family protein n=1 Tax=Bacillus pinisoli TaxID=2901866 RepID=UPI001FF15905|nr:CdaR family protein [Bacillus pinisoli]